MALIYGSSQTNPNYSNFQGSQTYAPRSRPGVSVPYIGTRVGGGGTPAPAPSGGGGGGDNGGGGPSPEDLLNGAYDEYYRQLDAQMSGLESQKGAQEQIANNTYNQGYNTVTNQYDQGQKELLGNREKTLRDLSNNLMQSWQQGNTYLGSRGASDSSAANQYAYALTKMGNQSRGDVQGQYDNNLFKLKTTYDTETKNLELAKNTQLQQISQWFAESQNALRSQKGQAALQKSQQALSMAMQMAQQVQQQTANQRAALDTWAANHAKTFNELRGQLAQNAQWSMQAPNNFGMSYTAPQGNGVTTGYGGVSNDKYDMWGNLIR